MSTDFDFIRIASLLQSARHICSTIAKVLLVQYRSRRGSDYLSWIEDTLQERGATLVPYDLKGKATQSSGKAICMNRGSSFLCERPDIGTFTSRREQEVAAVATLASYGYLQRGETFIHIRDFARFFFVNELGPLVIYPLGDALWQLVKALESQPGKVWKADPGDLVYIHPVAKGGSRERSTANKRMDRSGVLPFLTQSSKDLVPRVLTKLGYSYSDGGESAICDFWERNRKLLEKAGIPRIDLQTVSCRERERILIKAFCSRGGRGYWRVPIQHTVLAHPPTL